VLAAAEKSELALGQRQLVREQSRERAEFLRDQIRAQADLARAQAEIRRAAIEQIRSRGDFEFRPESDGSRGLTVLCPKTYARILARTERAADVVSARVEVGDSF